MAFRATSAKPGRASPVDPIISKGGTKRKERDFDPDTAIQETNINVAVRCRGRNSREVKENNGVVVSTDGVMGKTVKLSMGVNALSNKTYGFDRVFSPAADQGMMFGEVVTPILDEVLAGFNCTIFAYGQTGTGKTYTMSGNITDTMPLPDDAGIIPRVFNRLFQILESDEAESSVKCSFIELYNEELRDLLAADDIVKLKIFDDTARKSHGATLVQGVEETYINTASKGISLLRVGSHKRQVAATKCNDLSSRSHTVFTITTYVKQKSESGEEYVVSGKLNLVDLAGSENIQRSGAVNKRAAEAGLINKSLLTLGRVINALVEKSSHIPYRESKLTRLLQDSLGGRTRTCIIATLSPAESNLEETISTLDYAFRAKNIRNKPQSNQLISKKRLIRECTTEIEKLKGELVAARQRNGVYLNLDAYEELTNESESRRILGEEQRDKIETMESNLRNKTQELFSLTSNLMNLKKDSEKTRQALENAQGTLQKTDMVLAHTRQNLAEEKVLRHAHEESETKLTDIGRDLIGTLGRTTGDLTGLYNKNRRKSDLQSVNRSNWALSQKHVADITMAIEQRISEVAGNSQGLINQLYYRLHGFIEEEVAQLKESQSSIAEKTTAFEAMEAQLNQQALNARDEMDCVLESITLLRQRVRTDVGNGFDKMSDAAQPISAKVVEELQQIRTQLHQSYSALGKECGTVLNNLFNELVAQRQEADVLRHQLADAGMALAQANRANAAKIGAVVAAEQEQRALDRAHLTSQISTLIQTFGEVSDERLEAKGADLRKDLEMSHENFARAQTAYEDGMVHWLSRDKELHDGATHSKERVKQRVKSDWTFADQRMTSISDTTKSVHQDMVRVMGAQMSLMDQQLSPLDDILARAHVQNSRRHDAHAQSVSAVGSLVKQSYSSTADHIAGATERAQTLSSDIDYHADSLTSLLEPLYMDVQIPLAELRTDVMATSLLEDEPTGATPRRTNYTYTTSLPHTSPHNVLLARFRGLETISKERGTEAPEAKMSVRTSPNKVRIFKDDEGTPRSSLAKVSSCSQPASNSLQEIDLNVIGTGDSRPLKKSRKDQHLLHPRLQNISERDSS